MRKNNPFDTDWNRFDQHFDKSEAFFDKFMDHPVKSVFKVWIIGAILSGLAWLLGIAAVLLLVKVIFF